VVQLSGVGRGPAAPAVERRPFLYETMGLGWISRGALKMVVEVRNPWRRAGGGVRSGVD